MFLAKIGLIKSINGKARTVSQVTVFRRATQSGLREAKMQASPTASCAGSIPAFATKIKNNTTWH
jgi:hypothetical protein